MLRRVDNVRDPSVLRFARVRCNLIFLTLRRELVNFRRRLVWYVNVAGRPSATRLTRVRQFVLNLMTGVKRANSSLLLVGEGRRITEGVTRAPVRVTKVPSVRGDSVSGFRQYTLVVRRPSCRLLKFLLSALRVGLVLIRNNASKVGTGCLNCSVASVLILREDASNRVLRLVMSGVSFVLNLDLI